MGDCLFNIGTTIKSAKNLLYIIYIYILHTYMYIMKTPFPAVYGNIDICLELQSKHLNAEHGQHEQNEDSYRFYFKCSQATSFFFCVSIEIILSISEKIALKTIIHESAVN